MTLILVWIILSCPHLMLTNVSNNNGITLSQFTDTLDNCLRLYHTFFLIVRTYTLFVFCDFFNPFFSVILNHWLCQEHFKSLLGITNNWKVHCNNFTNLSWIYINMDNLSILSKCFRITCQTIIKTTTNSNHKISIRHSNVSRI